MGLSAAEREIFEAQLSLDEGDPKKAAELAYRSMIAAARALARETNPNLSEDPDEIVSVFKKNLVETRIFLDQYAGDKFASYLFSAHEKGARDDSPAAARELIEESQLFIEASHACHQKMLAQTHAAE
jgi:sulfite reductase (ferredoxin)